MATNDIKEKMVKTNPWKGLNYYKEGETLYGRDDEIQSLALYVINNIQTVLYGKSGIGKSSIINAGVFPIARKEGLFPIPIRLKHDKDTSYIAQIKAAFQESGIGIKEVLPAINEQEESLWEYLHRHLFYHVVTKGPVRPLIVLDQFEEIFTLQQNENKKKAFFSELADLLNEVIPQYIINANNDGSQSKDQEPASTNSAFVLDLGSNEAEETEEYLSESLFNIVFTIREDFLSYLERYTRFIPVMKSNRYALLPLNEEQAKDIIMKPMSGLVNIDVAKLIIEKVTGRTDFSLGDAPEIEVDAAVLSLYLSRLFIKKGASSEITATLVDESSKDIIKDFYEESISNLPVKDIEKIEDQLITYEGRRNNVSRNDLISEGVSKTTIHTLVEDKKLLRQFSYQDDIRVEYMHDILCPIVNTRIEHREQLAKEREAQKKREEEDARMEKERLIQEEKLRKAEEDKQILLRKQHLAEREKQLQQEQLVRAEKERNLLLRQQELQEKEKEILLRKQEEERKKLEEEKLLVSKKRSRNKKYTLLLFAVATVLFIISFVISSMYIQNEKQSEKLNALNNEIQTILPSVIEQEIKDGNSYNAGKLLLKLYPDTLYVAGDPARTSLLRELSGRMSTILNGHTRSVNMAIFSNDGKYAITGSDDMTVKIWDSTTGYLISSIKTGSPIISLAISPDDKKLVVSTKEGSLITYSVTNGYLNLKDSLSQKGSYARFVSYNPTGSEILACFTNGNLLVCNSSNLSLFKAYKISKAGATYITFDKNGQKMALAGTDNTIMIWDATQYTLTNTLSGHKDWVRSVDFSSDGERLVSCSDDKKVRLWNLKTRACTIVADLPDWVTKAVFSPDGKRIISSSKDGLLRMIDIGTLCEIPELQIRQSNYLKQFDLSPDGRRVITSSPDKVVHIWDCGNPMETNVSLRLPGAIHGLSFVGSKKMIAGVSNNGTLAIWDYQTGNNILKREVKQGRVTSLKVSPNGKIIALSSGSKILLFDSDTGVELDVDNTDGHRGWIRNLCFSHDGKTLASVGEDQLIILWDIDKRKVKKRIHGHDSGIYAVDFSKDDKRLVTGSKDTTIRQWNTTDGNQIGNTIIGHKNVVLSVRYNSNDSLILSSSGDQTACLWKTDGTLVNQFVGASGYMSDAIFGLTEEEIITASADKCIRIWCVANGKETNRLEGHLGAVSYLALSDDGTLISSDHVGGINVWKIPSLITIAEELSKKYNKER